MSKFRNRSASEFGNVYLGNLPNSITEPEIENMIQDFDGVELLRLIKKENKTYCFLACENEGIVINVVRTLSKKVIMGRNVIARSSNENLQRKCMEDGGACKPSASFDRGRNACQQRKEMSEKPIPHKGPCAPSNEVPPEEESWEDSAITDDGPPPLAPNPEMVVWAARPPPLSLSPHSVTSPSNDIGQYSEKCHGNHSHGQEDRFQDNPVDHCPRYDTPNGKKGSVVHDGPPELAYANRPHYEHYAKYSESSSYDENLSTPEFQHSGRHSASKNSQMHQHVIKNNFPNKSKLSHAVEYTEGFRSSPDSRHVASNRSYSDPSGSDCSDVPKPAQNAVHSSQNSSLSNKSSQSDHSYSSSSTSHCHDKQSSEESDRHTRKYNSPCQNRQSHLDRYQPRGREPHRADRPFYPEEQTTLPYDKQYPCTVRAQYSYCPRNDPCIPDPDDVNEDDSGNVLSEEDIQCAVSVSNFPFYTTEEEIFSLFEDFEPLYIHMISNVYRRGQCTEAYVVLPNEASALDAIMHLDNTEYKRRTLLVTDITESGILTDLLVLYGLQDLNQDIVA